jgi:hypothetical protein
MARLMGRWSRIWLLIVVAVTPVPGWAFEESVHDLLATYAFFDRDRWNRERIEPAPREAPEEFRQCLYGRILGMNDDELVGRFRARFPTFDNFDRWGFKEFLGVSPAAEVWGVDRFHNTRMRRLELMAEAARHPIADQRDRERFAYDTGRRVLNDARGVALPYDPATVHGWALTGLASQRAAHWALPRDQVYSSDSNVLRSEPWRFAAPEGLHSFAASRACSYTEMSVLAALWGGEGAEYLSLLYAGHAHHYLADAADQLHTVQMGTLAMWSEARAQARLEKLRTLGGLLGDRVGFERLWQAIVRNHRVFAEQLWAQELELESDIRRAGGRPHDPAVAAALEGVGLDDTELLAGLERGDNFCWELCEALAQVGARESAALFDAVYAFSVRDIHRGTFGFNDANAPSGSDDPGDFVREGAEADAARARFKELNGRAMQRAGTALRVWMAERDRVLKLPTMPSEGDLEELGSRERAELVAAAQERVDGSRAAQVDAALARWVKERLDELDSAERRRAAWMPPDDSEPELLVGYPIGAAILIALVLGLYVGGARLGSERRRPRRELRF